ncbi:MAG: DUF3261 domain-containing protein [Candidatus Margulisbacteria bacterium]|jgi:hypothetical protein|nr:DUF3261 domain-containing protein [Candidatus Margulisiibacteriota bacterium]
MKHGLVAALLLILAVFFGGCASRDSPLQFFIANGLAAQLLPTAEFAGNKALIMDMGISYAGRTMNITSAVKLTAEQIKVIALADLARLFTISYDGSAIDTEYSAVAKTYPIPPVYILADIQLIYYPLAALKKHLPAALTVTEKDNVRLISKAQTEIIRISYTDQSIRLENNERKYAYNIALREAE